MIITLDSSATSTLAALADTIISNALPGQLLGVNAGGFWANFGPSDLGLLRAADAIDFTGALSSAEALTIRNQSSLRLGELTANGSHYVALRSPAALASSYTLTFPSSLGVDGQVLGLASGSLEWLDVDFLSLAGFEPSTVTLLFGRSGGQTLRGGSDASDNLTLDSTTSATKGKVRSLSDLELVGNKSLRLTGLNGTNSVVLKSPTTVAADVTYTLPSANGAANSALVNDGSGTLSWSSIPSIVDHDDLGGLGDDDHTQYAMLDGRAGGQRLAGGTAAGEHLSLESTLHGTKGQIRSLSDFELRSNKGIRFTGASGNNVLVLKAPATVPVDGVTHYLPPTLGTAGQSLVTDGAGNWGWTTLTADHGGLGGLGDDDHTQYLRLAGRAGGQTVIGGTAAGEGLTLESTSNATKGLLQVAGGTKLRLLGAANAGEIQLAEASANGTSVLGIKAAAAMAADFTLTMPDALPPSPNQVIVFSTSGVGSWSSLSAGGGGGGAITIGPSDGTPTPVSATEMYIDDASLLSVAIAGTVVTVSPKSDAANNGKVWSTLAGTAGWSTPGATSGGTGQTTWATGDMLYASAANTLAKLAAGSAGQLLHIAGGIPAWTSTLDNASLVVRLANGSAAAPSLAANADTNTGLYFSAADEISIATAGNQRIAFRSNGNVEILGAGGMTAGGDIAAAGTVTSSGAGGLVATSGGVTAQTNVVATTGSVTANQNVTATLGDVTAGGRALVGDGTNLLPSLTFSGDTDLGIYRVSANTLGITTGGTKRAEVSSAGLNLVSGILQLLDGAAAAPVFTFASDANTGIYRPNADQIGFATGGALRATIRDAGILLASGRSIEFGDGTTLTTAPVGGGDTLGGSAMRRYFSGALQMLNAFSGTAFDTPNGGFLDGYTANPGKVDVGASTNAVYGTKSWYNSPTYTNTWASTGYVSETDSYAGYTMRTMIPASGISTSGSGCRVTFKGAGGEGLAINKAYIGEKAASGDPCDFAASPAPVQMFFDGGSASTSIGADAEKTSDLINFAIDETKSYVVSFFIAGSSGSADRLRLETNTGGHWQYLTGDQVAVLDGSGYGGNLANRSGNVVRLQVTNGFNDMTLQSATQTMASAPASAYILGHIDWGAASPVLGTDLIAEVSRNGGTNWTAVSLTNHGAVQGTRKVVDGTVDLSGQPSGTQLKVRWRTDNNISYVFYGTAVEVPE